MKDNIKVSSLQIGVLTFFLSQVSFFPLISKILFKTVNQDIWISIIFGFLLGLIILKLFLKFQNRLEYKNIVLYNLEKYGKILGNIFNLILVFIITLAVVFLFSKFCIFLNVNYLPNLPIIVIEITFILLIIYAVKKNIQAILRTSQILVIISIILFISAIVLNSYNFNFDNIFPIFEHNITNIFISAINYALASTLPVFLLTVFPKNIVNKKEQYNKSIIWGYTVSSIVTFIILFTTLLILGKHLIITFEYPEYIAFKQIQYFYFIERFENVFSMIWIFNIFIFSVLSLYFIYDYIKNTFKIKDNNFILILIGIILVLISNCIIFLN